MAVVTVGSLDGCTRQVKLESCRGGLFVTKTPEIPIAKSRIYIFDFIFFTKLMSSYQQTPPQHQTLCKKASTGPPLATCKH